MHSLEPTSPAPPTPAQRLDRLLAGPMFWLAFIFLVLAAGVLHRIGREFHSYLEVEVISWTLLILWPIFAVEGILRVTYAVRPDRLPRRLTYFALLLLLPPLRMGSRSYADVDRMWLPRWKWCTVDRHLRKRLERFFSVPMMVIALLVVPVLAIEHFWGDRVRERFDAQLFLDIAESVIWMAFALEFILMISVAEKKLRYCFTNWMDLAIVALPLLDFLPLLRTLRLTRVLELQQMTRLGRLYRLRGLLLKLWRAILLLDVLYRLIGNAKERRLLRLKELLTAKKEEIDDLLKEIDELERELSAKKAVEPKTELPPSEPLSPATQPEPIAERSA